jgi:hypothetical protein
VRRLTPALALLGIACAQVGAPPGGPTITVPPKLVGTLPESGAVNVRANAPVSFTFDAVISEAGGRGGGRGTAGGGSSLSQFAIISPRDGEPKVGWHRQTLTVRGQRDWKPNTAYTVTLLPGISDLRGNARRVPATVVFSTGPTIPQDAITGIVFDWVAGTPIANPVVEALARPDTTIVYVARGDSSGRFTLAHMLPGTYTVRAYNDLNTNRQLDVREPWDSVHVVLKDTAHAELLAFVHDTVGPIIDQVRVIDSLTVRARFDRAIDPAQRIDTALFTLKRADSTVVPLRLVESARTWDSTHVNPADTTRARADTTGRRPPPPRGARGAADTTHRAPLPRPTRPSPVTEVVIELATPLAPDATYRLQTRGVKNLLGYAASGSRSFQVPKTPAAPPPKPAPAPRDTTKRPPAR